MQHLAALTCSTLLLGSTATVNTPYPIEHCPDVTVLRDVKDGWYDGCLGLVNYPDEGTVGLCKQGCYDDMACSVWQFHEGGCYRGNDPYRCRTRQEGAFRAEAGERIMHGDVKVVNNGQKCSGWKAIDFNEKTYDDISKADRCRHACYSNVFCSAWAYGEGKCYYGHGQDCVEDAAWRNTMVASESVQHYCPSTGKVIGEPGATPYVPPTASAAPATQPGATVVGGPNPQPNTGSGWSPGNGWASSGAGRDDRTGLGPGFHSPKDLLPFLLLALLLACILCLLCRGCANRKRRTKTRAVVEPYQEEEIVETSRLLAVPTQQLVQQPLVQQPVMPMYAPLTAAQQLI